VAADRGLKIEVSEGKGARYGGGGRGVAPGVTGKDKPRAPSKIKEDLDARP